VAINVMGDSGPSYYSGAHRYRSSIVMKNGAAEFLND
jgi:hypothetical protein